MNPQTFAALHALMVHQREERRATGRPLRTGDLVQAHIGGEIRQVEEHESADAYVARKAMERPMFSIEGSATGTCALHGGRRHWSGPKAAKE